MTIFMLVHLGANEEEGGGGGGKVPTIILFEAQSISQRWHLFVRTLKV